MSVALGIREQLSHGGDQRHAGTILSTTTSTSFLRRLSVKGRPGAMQSLVIKTSQEAHQAVLVVPPKLAKHHDEFHCIDVLIPAAVV